MAKQASAVAQRPGVLTRVRVFVQEVKAELGKVVWPTKDELKSHTSVVLFLLFVMAGIVFVLDKAADTLLKLLLLLA